MNKKYSFKRLFASLVLLVLLVPASGRVAAQQSKSNFDLFLGAGFTLSDMNWYHQYDYLLSLSPGFRYDFGDHWHVTGLVWVPVAYSEIYELAAHFTPELLAISKEQKVGDLCLKASAGLFSNSRYGLDLKAFMPITSWFALEGQVGLTGRAVFQGFGNGDLYAVSDMSRLTFLAGGDIYLSRWNTQLRGTMGRYVFEDYGVQCEAMRHFRHSTVSLYARWSDRAGLNDKLKDGLDAGFTITVMLPPYRRADRTFHVRPISNYSIEYMFNALSTINNIYHTDAEENIRDGWFSRDLLDWGSHTMEPDYTTKGKEGKE